MGYEHFTLTPPQDQLIGHRGIAALAPENTMTSFRLAVSQAINWIEFDVRLTKDHELIIFHDDTLERTTNGTGFVYENNLEQLLNLDAGSWFAPHFAGESIPLFNKAFPQFLRWGLHCNIEMKFPPQPDDRHIEVLVSRLCDILQSQWSPLYPSPLISSFEWKAVEWVRNKLPNFPIGFLSEDCNSSLIQQIAKIPNAALHCDYLALTPDLLAQARNAKVPILAYTVNEASIAHHLFSENVFGVFSDNPQHLRRA
ncbi:MAG TPA: glycerophosphodiester phosphodiesterase family protein [Candidatus Berkiella sp.]|nr:glycerophosphodiester phosphodiesterase family protein [Candidatus Berkiella sp.]